MQSRSPRILYLLVFTALLLVAAAGCGDDDSTGLDAGLDGTADASPDAQVTPPTECELLGLSERPFIDAAPDDPPVLGSLASDVELSTTEGTYGLKDQWTGCDVILFIPDLPTQVGTGFNYEMWDRATDVQDLFTRLPRNARVFFYSLRTDPDERYAAVDALVLVVDQVLDAMSAEDRDWWSRRVHFLRRRVAEIDGWPGTLLRRPGFGLVVDRFQRIRFIGGFGDPTRYSSTAGWFGPNVAMAANEAIYHNRQAELQDHMDAENATVVTLWDATPLAANGGGAFPVTVTLPDAATLATFDTLELELGMTCVGEGEYGYCPAWDYDVFLRMCETVDATSCDLEVGHWITSYHREGHFLHDVSGLLPLLADGGPHKFTFHVSDPWEIDLHLRLSNQGKAQRPIETVPLWNATHTLDATYNTYWEPQTVDVPADAVRVELVSAITGHGMSQPGNCAEFCNTDHHFYVNGTDNLRDFPVTVDDPSFGCQAQVADGTVPNQHGTWWYGRAGWCPGKQVDHTVVDVTSEVTPGAENLIEYEGYYQGQPYEGDSWRHIHVAAWLVIYR